MLENRIGRLQDDLQDTVNLSQAGGGGNGSGAENVALMIRQQHKKAKPVNIFFVKSRALQKYAGNYFLQVKFGRK